MAYIMCHNLVYGGYPQIIVFNSPNNAVVSDLCKEMDAITCGF